VETRVEPSGNRGGTKLETGAKKRKLEWRQAETGAETSGDWCGAKWRLMWRQVETRAKTSGNWWILDLSLDTK